MSARHVLVAAAALLLLAACGGAADPAPGGAPVPPGDGLLQQAAGGDGDSWRDTAGREYRLGLVDAPEVGTCFADQATERRRALLAGGFRAEVYDTDGYGRQVAVVTTADGADVAVALAREGLVTDRYLAELRGQAPELARRLDRAFAKARQDRVGLWAVCPRPGEQTGRPVEPPDRSSSR